MADDRDSRWVDFKSVRASVSFPALLEKLEVLDKLKGKGDRRQGPCPLHRPESSTSTSFSVDLKRGMFNCFACRQHGNVLDFTAAYLKVDLRTAALQLCDWFGLATGKEVRRDQPPLPPAQPTQPEKPAGEPAAASPAETAEGREHDHEAGNPVLTFRHGKGLLLDPEHETVKAWGLKPETVAFFGMGYSERSKVVGKRVAVPIHNEDGDLIGYAGRATMNAQIVEKGKWTLPAGFHKKLVVFNLCRAKDHCCDRPVIVVEGFRACITLHERGYPNTVALMGNTISPQQVELLAKHISSRRAIVLLDGNNAGREATPAVVTALAAKLWVRAILLEDDRQPDDLSAPELHATLDQLR